MKTIKSISRWNKLKAFPTTLITYSLSFLVIIFLFIPALLLACIPEHYRPQRFFFWLLDKIYKGIVYALLVRVRAQGKSLIPREPAIFVANHESSIDIPLLGMLMKNKPHFWFIFEYYMRLPVFGFLARQVGISVPQNNVARDARAVITGLRRVEQSVAQMLVFPEGGRFNDGTVHEFFQGFALIAKKTKRPVVPVFLKNPGKVFPPGSFLIYRYPLTVIVGQPFVFEEQDTLESFSERVHAWFDGHCN